MGFGVLGVWVFCDTLFVNLGHLEDAKERPLLNHVPSVPKIVCSWGLVFLRKDAPPQALDKIRTCIKTSPSPESLQAVS
jgi:hypothetical protein